MITRFFKTNILVVLIYLLMLGCSNPLQKEINRQEGIFIENINIIPLNKDTVLYGKDVVIRGNRIVRIADHHRSLSIASPAWKMINGTGKYMMPGLADCHVHYAGDRSIFREDDQLFIKYGVTRVLDLNGSTALLHHRDSLKKNELIGPDLLCASSIVNDSTLTSGGALRLLKTYKDEGYTFVKVYSFLSKEGFLTISSEAPKYGLRVIGHIPQKVGTWGVLHSNQELIAHVEEFLYNPPITYFMGNFTKPAEPDTNYIPALADSVFAAHKSVASTLIAFYSIMRSASDLKGYIKTVPLKAPDPVVHYWDWEKSDFPKKFRSALSKHRLASAFDFQLKMINALNKKGVLLLAGTDAPSLPGLVPGYSLHQELNLLHKAGLSNFEALKAATVNPAKFLHMSRIAGTVEEGKEADLVILEKNPLNSLRNTLLIDCIILNGRCAFNTHRIIIE